MKKTLLLFLILCMSFSLFSCANVTDIPKDDGDEINFHGEKLNLYTHSWSLAVFTDTVPANTDASRERRAKHIKKFEDDYNIVVNISESSTAKIIGDMMNGTRTADLIYMYPYYLYDIYSAGALLPYDSIPDIDYFGGKFGPEKLLDQTLFGGKYYGIFTYMWESPPSLQGVLWINDGLISEINGMTNPRELIESDKWNWETFREVCKQGTYSDEGEKHFAFGIANHGDSPASDMLALECIYSNGGNPLFRENGIYRSGLKDPKVTEALEYAASLKNDDIILYGVSGLSYTAWIYGQHPLYLAESYYVAKEDSPNALTDYGLISFPKGPSANENSVGCFYYNTDHFTSVCAGTIFSEDEIAVIINRLFDRYENSPYPEGWQSYSIENSFIHENDFYTYLNALENAEYYNTTVFTSIAEEITEAFDSIIVNGVSPETAVDSISDAFTQSINEYYNQ